MHYEEHVYTIEITIIGKQPKRILQKIKRRLRADHVKLVGEKTFEHEGVCDETPVPK